MKSCQHTLEAERLLTELVWLTSELRLTKVIGKNPYGVQTEYVEAEPFYKYLASLRDRAWALIQVIENE